MALSADYKTKGYTPSSGQTANSALYNTDIGNLFNANSDLDDQTASLGGLTITPTSDGAEQFKITNAADSWDVLIIGTETTGNIFTLDNNGTQHGFYLLQDGVLASGKHAFYLYSNAAQINDRLLNIHQDNASSTADIAHMTNDGTGIGLYINQVGELALGKRALDVYSNTAQTTAPFIRFELDNASSTQDVLYVQNDGTGPGIKAVQSGNGTGFEIDNDGTSHGIYLHLDNNLAADQFGIYVLSGTAQTNSNLVRIYANDAATTGEPLYIRQDGTGGTINIQQRGVQAATKYGFLLYSDVAQVNEPLALIQQDHASSDQNCLVVDDDGTGGCLLLDQDGNGIALDIDSECANDTMMFRATPAGTSPDTFAIYRNDDVTGNVVVKIGSGYLWVDASNDLRYGTAYPSADGGGSVVAMV